MTSKNASRICNNVVKYLSPKHRDDLYESGLTDETIERCGFYTESDPEIVRQHLNWNTIDQLEKMGPFLAIPYPDRQGRETDFIRYKPDWPRSYCNENGKRKAVKYESPIGVSTRPYFPVMALSAINTSGADLFITEGEKKSGKATQEGFPCIALPGVTNWSKPRRKDRNGKSIGRRKLHDDLAAIDWQDRRVFIVFDTDERRNPNVAREAAELARVLEDHGATVHIVHLPVCRDGKTIVKQGLDDFLVRCGRKKFQAILDTCLFVPETVSLEEYRSRMSDNYRIIFSPGFYLNAAPTGIGKTWLDIHRAKKARRSIFLVPTHDQEADLISMGRENGLTIIPYPIRSKATCPCFDEVQKLEEQGFNPTEILCPHCKHKPGRSKKKPCKYYKALDMVKKAPRVCATHERFRLVGEGLLENRDFVSIQEDAINVQAGVMTARTGFAKLADLAWWAGLNGANRDFCDGLYQAASYFNNIILGAETTEIIPVDIFQWEYRHSSKSIHDLIQLRDHNNELFGRPRMRYLVRKGRAVQEVRPGWNYVPSGLLGGFDPDAVRFMTAVLSGRFSRIYLNVLETYKNEMVVELLGILKVPDCEKSIIIFGDATADTELVPQEFQGMLANITPNCQPERLQNVVQYPVDITRTTSESRFIGIVRELLRLYPDRRKIGIITHKCLEKYLDTEKTQLTEPERKRIVKIDHFFGTESRGSNSWKKDCDALFVLGTPRPPEEMVQRRLLQLGNVEAARQSGDWSKVDYWSGRRLDGRRETVRSRGYRNHDWHAAFRQIVRAELVQSIGRARPNNADGIPTVVVSVEDVDVPLANEPLQLLTRTQVENAVPVYAALLGIGGLGCPSVDDPAARQEWFLGAFDKLTASSSYIYSYKKKLPLAPAGAMTGEKLAELLNEPARTVRHRLATLLQAGLLSRKGQRGGYFITQADFDYFKAAGKPLLFAPVQTPVPSANRHFAEPIYWTPDKKFAGSDRFSLYALSDSTRLRMAAVHDGHSTYLVKPDDLDSFLDHCENRTLITYDIAQTYREIDAATGNNGKIYGYLHGKRFVGVHNAGRLLSLGGGNDPEAFDSLGHLAESLGMKECDKLVGNSEALDFDDNLDEIPDPQLRSLVDHAEVLFKVACKMEQENDILYEEIKANPPFGLPEDENYLDAVRRRYGDLTHDIQAMAEIVYGQISQNGVCIDRKRVRSLRIHTEKELVRLIESMKKFGYRSNQVDTNEARRILTLYERRYNVCFEEIADGEISVSKKQLERYANRFPFIRAYLQAAGLDRVLRNWLAKMNIDRVFPEYNTLTKTGRTSCGGTLPMQGVPGSGGIRECFVPSPGHVFVTADLTGAELGTLGQVLIWMYGKSKLADLINDGIDVHTTVASWLFNKREPEVTESERKQAKVLNFGIPGGIGAAALCKNALEQYEIKWQKREAEDLIERWLERFPEVRRYLAKTREEHDGAMTPTGRLRPKSDYCQTRNYLFQGLAADGMTLGLWNLHRAGYRIVNVIHDEVLVEVPISDDYTDVVQDIEFKIIAGMREVTPDVAARVTSSVSTRWSKKAELIQDAQGRIICWTDKEDSPDIFEKVFVPKRTRVIHSKGRPQLFLDYESPINAVR